MGEHRYRDPPVCPLASKAELAKDRERILAETGLSGKTLDFKQWVGAGGFRARVWVAKLAEFEVPVAVRNLRLLRDTTQDRLDREDIERRVRQEGWGRRPVRQSREDPAWFLPRIDPTDEQAIAQHLLVDFEPDPYEDA